MKALARKLASLVALVPLAAFLPLVAIDLEVCKGKGATYNPADCGLLSGPPCLLCSQDNSCQSCSPQYVPDPVGGGQEHCTCGMETQQHPCCHTIIVLDSEGNRLVGKAGVCRSTLAGCSAGKCNKTYVLAVDLEGKAYAIAEFKCI